jgi:hypothetical protein
MIELMVVTLLSLWTADNQEFLTKAPFSGWQYVGYTETQPGPQTDGSVVLTAEQQGRTFILFKQKPNVQQVADRHMAE